MTKKTFYISILSVGLVLLSLLSDAQVSQPQRFEKKQKGGDEYFSIFSLKEHGLGLLRENNDFKGGKQLWQFILLDTALREKSEFTIAIEPRYPLVGYEYFKDHLYLLYRMGEHNRNSLEMIDLDIIEGKELKRYEIKPELDFKLTHFNRVGNNILLGGYVSNDPALLLYDLEDSQIKVVPGFFQKDNELVDVRINQNQTFNVVIIDRSLRSERKLVFRTFDDTGKLLLEDVVPIDDDRSLQTSISSSLEREDLMILGTWGDRQGKQSSGFFALPVDPFREQKINYFNFGQLDHFTDYLNPKRAGRVKENAKDAANAGRKPNFSAYVVPFQIQENANGFLMLAEVYTPSSNTNPYYSNPYSPYYANPYFYNPFWGSYYPGMRMYRPYNYGNNVKSADEVKSHASVLVAFDAKGNAKWDQSLQFDEIRKPSLEQVSDYYFGKDKVYFLYKKESELKIKIIDIADGDTKELTQKVQMLSPQDEVRNEKDYEDGVKHWFGNTFYTWGYQTIRNVLNKEDRTRDVFYINKVVIK